MTETALKRSISLPSLTLYSLGTIVGAGFYALLGDVAAIAGPLTPWAFLAGCIAALFAMLTYAEFATRYPQSGGVAIYAQRAFGKEGLSGLLGWTAIATGVVSAAVLTHAFAGYLTEFIRLPDWLVFTLFVLALGALAAWGISESVMVAVVITAIEVGGMLLVAGAVISGGEFRGAEPSALVPSLSMMDAGAILLGGFLSLYAFIGFEDVVNVAEEVKQPRRTLPKALMISLGITTLLYLGVSIVAVLATPLPELQGSEAPLADVVRRRGPGWAVTVSLIGLLAGINGALVQIIMASRVMYGMGRDGISFSWLGVAHPYTRTPVRATIFASMLVLVLALSLDIAALAGITSFIALLLFAVMHAGLLRLKHCEESAPDAFVLSPVIQWLGLATIAILMVARVLSWLG